MRLLLVAVFAAQISTGPAFEAASVKRSAAGATLFDTTVGTSPGGRWTARNASLTLILLTTYDVAREQIAGGPPWLNSERFDIVATAGREVDRTTLRQMLERLLAERFQLRLHREQRELEVSALVRARADGQLGRGLTPNAVCSAPEATRPAAATCGRTTLRPVDGITHLRMTGHPLQNLIPLASLRAVAGGLVIDRTGLDGTFDIELDYVAQSAQIGASTVPGPALTTALAEQLGLRLERRREMVDVLVIEDVAMPAPD